MNCLNCKKNVKKEGKKYCSQLCWQTSKEHKKLVSKMFKGTKLSDKHKKKLSLAKLGKKQSKGFVKKRLYWIKGYKWKKETIQKRANSNRGKKREGVALDNIQNSIAKVRGYENYSLMPHGPLWRGLDWHDQRAEALKRDHHTCQHCRRKTMLDVHHIIPFRRSKDNSLENLITLCKSCHHRLEPGKDEDIVRTVWRHTEVRRNYSLALKKSSNN
jgi:phage terminase large subunit GpA-like protein